MWRRVSCEQQSDIVCGLLRKLERFRHAVVEPSCRGVLRSLARFRALARVGAVFVVFPSSVVSSISVCASGHLTRHVHWLKGTQQYVLVILSFAPILSCHFIIHFQFFF